MGLSVTGYLTYGIILAEEDEQPWSDIGCEINDPDGVETWWRNKHGKGTRCPYECISTRSGSDPLLILTPTDVDGLHTYAWSDTPVDVTGFNLSRLPVIDEKLKEFCRDNRIRTKGEPGWYLSSDYSH